MNTLIFLIELSKKQEHIIRTSLIVLFLFTFLLLIIGLLGTLIEKIMTKQAKKVDSYMSNLVFSRVCDNPKKFIKLAIKKNHIAFFKDAIIPILLIAFGILIWILYHSAYGRWDESIFDYKTGILSLFYILDFSEVKYVFPLGFDGIKLANTPHFLTNETFLNYLIFLFTFSGFIYYLVCVQAYVARLKRSYKLKKTIYSKNLDNIDMEHFYNKDKINPYNNQDNKNSVNNK